MCLIVVGALPPLGFLFSVFQNARPPATPRRLGPPLTERSKTLGPWAPDQDSRLAYSTKVACNSLRKPYKGSIYNKRVRPPAPFPLAAHTTQVSPRSPPRGTGGGGGIRPLSPL